MSKNILITGSTGGIGKEIVKALAKEADNLFLTFQKYDKNCEEIAKLNKNICFFSVDLLKVKEINRMMNNILEIGTVDIVIHCVSSKIKHANAIEKEWEDYKKHLDIQVKALHTILKKTIPKMKQKGKGKIITIVTEYVSGTPPTNLADYVTAKYALLGFSKCLSVEYGKYNITSNCVSPSLIETKLTAKIPNKLKEITALKTPLKRLCTTQDVAGVVKFLCSKEADFINGQNIIVNGGR